MCKTRLYSVSYCSTAKPAFSEEVVENFSHGRAGERGAEEGISRNKSAQKENRKEKSGTLKDDSCI